MCIRDSFQAFTEIISLLTRHRDLTWEMAKRELSDRYAGQAFGLMWAIGHPAVSYTHLDVYKRQTLYQVIHLRFRSQLRIRR